MPALVSSWFRLKDSHGLSKSIFAYGKERAGYALGPFRQAYDAALISVMWMVLVALFNVPVTFSFSGLNYLGETLSVLVAAQGFATTGIFALAHNNSQPQ